MTIALPSALELKIDLTDEQFLQLCQNNRDLKFERTAAGDLIIMPPTGGTTGDRSADLTFQLRAWNRQHRLGNLTPLRDSSYPVAQIALPMRPRSPKNDGIPSRPISKINSRLSVPIL